MASIDLNIIQRGWPLILTGQQVQVGLRRPIWEVLENKELTMVAR